MRETSGKRAIQRARRLRRHLGHEMPGRQTLGDPQRILRGNGDRAAFTEGACPCAAAPAGHPTVDLTVVSGIRSWLGAHCDALDGVGGACELAFGSPIDWYSAI